GSPSSGATEQALKFAALFSIQNPLQRAISRDFHLALDKSVVRVKKLSGGSVSSATPPGTGTSGCWASGRSRVVVVTCSAATVAGTDTRRWTPEQCVGGPTSVSCVPCGSANATVCSAGSSV